MEGMRYITSTSSNDGTSQITVTFEPTRDIEVAAVDVQNRVSRAASRLPAQVNQTGIVVNKASSQLLMSLGLFSPDDRYDAKFLSNYADVNLKDALKRVRGVGEVRIFGERKFAMRLWLDPTELARRSLTAAGRGARAAGAEPAGGRRAGGPAARRTDEQPYQIAVRARGRLVEPEEFGDIVLQRSADGKLVRVKDVGRVELGAENYGQLLRFNGRTGVGLGIFQLPTANALDVRDGVIAELERLSQAVPAGAGVQAGHRHHAGGARLHQRGGAHAASRPSRWSSSSSSCSCTAGAACSSPRSPCRSRWWAPSPSSTLFGFSINTLTLFGLTLATGLVVDDAIVVIENIERLMARARSCRALRGGARGHEARWPARWWPSPSCWWRCSSRWRFFPGTTGAIYRQFALTIAASVALSTFCALTLTPALSALLLQHAPRARSGSSSAGWTGRSTGRGRLRPLAAPAARAPRRSMLVAFLLCSRGTVLLFRVGAHRLHPRRGPGLPHRSPCRAPRACRSPRPRRCWPGRGGAAGQQPEVRDHLRRRRLLLRRAPGPTTATSSSPSSRGRSAQARSSRWPALVERLRGPLARHRRSAGDALPAARHPRRGQRGRLPVRRRGRRGQRARWTSWPRPPRSWWRGATSSRSCAASSPPSPPTRPLLDVEVDRQKAKALGVPLEQIFGTLQVYMGSQYVNDFNYANRTYRVYVQAEQQFRDSPQDIGAFYVRTDSGDDDAAGVAGEGDAHHHRPDHPPLQPVPRRARSTARARPGVSSGQALEAMEAARRASDCPQGMSRRVDGHQPRAEGERRADADHLRAWASLFVFLVLAAQYESFTLPFVIILSVPLAILGALGLQVLRGLRQRRLLPGGPGDAGGPGQQERHPHRRVRRAAARAGQERGGRGDRGGRRCGCGPS